MNSIADQLKQAGYPMRHIFDNEHGVLTVLPSLGELIASCVPYFRSLTLANGTFVVEAVPELNVLPFYSTIAEESVAQLWLYLYKNGKKKIHTTT